MPEAATVWPSELYSINIELNSLVTVMSTIVDRYGKTTLFHMFNAFLESLLKILLFSYCVKF